MQAYLSTRVRMAFRVSRTILSMMTLGTDGAAVADPGECSPVDDEFELALESRRRRPLLCGQRKHYTWIVGKLGVRRKMYVRCTGLSAYVVRKVHEKLHPNSEMPITWKSVPEGRGAAVVFAAPAALPPAAEVDTRHPARTLPHFLLRSRRSSANPFQSPLRPSLA